MLLLNGSVTSVFISALFAAPLIFVQVGAGIVGPGDAVPLRSGVEAVGILGSSTRS